MNPAFYLIVIIVCVAIWFLASFLYRPIGKYIFKVGKDAMDNLNDTESEEKE